MDDFNNNDSNQFTPPVPPTPQPTPQSAPAAQPENPTVMPPPVNNNTYYQQAPVMSTPNVPAEKTTDGLGIASMVLGIISVVICCCYGIGLLLAIPGLILGLVAKKSPETGKRSGFALAGIIISAISIGLNLIWLIYVIYIIFHVDISDYSDYSEFWRYFQDQLGNEYDMFTKL